MDGLGWDGNGNGWRYLGARIGKTILNTQEKDSKQMGLFIVGLKKKEIEVK